MATVIPPVEVFLKWPRPNYDNPPTRATEMVAVEIPFLALCAAVVGLRFYTRSRIIRHGLAMDDYLTFGALVFLGVMVFLHLHGLKYHWGVHSWDMKLTDLEPLLKIVIATEIVFVLCVSLTKLSILAFYLRVFASTVQLRILTWIGVALVTSCGITMLFLTIFQCVPVAAYWDITITNHKCMNMYAALTAVSVINSVNEIYIFAIPIPWILHLNLPRRQRIGLIVAFGLGLITIAAGFARVYYILLMEKTWDVSWVGVPVYSATAVEGALGIIASSLPALKPLVVRYFPALMNSVSGSSSASGRRSRRHVWGSSGHRSAASRDRRNGSGWGTTEEVENADVEDSAVNVKRARMSSITKPSAVKLVEIDTGRLGGRRGNMPLKARVSPMEPGYASISPSAASSKGDVGEIREGSTERFARIE